MPGLSNYPPGVTGMEPEITGDWDCELGHNGPCTEECVTILTEMVTDHPDPADPPNPRQPRQTEVPVLVDGKIEWRTMVPTDCCDDLRWDEETQVGGNSAVSDDDGIRVCRVGYGCAVDPEQPLIDEAEGLDLIAREERETG